MATYFLGQYECRQYSDDNGDPLAGGAVASYLSGTSTPTPTYADVLGTPNPNPLVLDSAGRCSIYLNTELTYKFVITDAAGVTIDTVDPISPLPTVTPGNIFTVAPGAAAFPGFTFTGDENTGLYAPAPDILAVTTGGTERARWGPTGGMNIGGTTDPGDNNLRVEGTLNVQGAATLSGTLTVAGGATFSGGIVGTLSAAGLTVTTLGATNATIGTLDVTGNQTIAGTLGVTGATTLGGLTVTASETVQGTLVVQGATTVLSTFHAVGATTLDNTLRVTGASTLQGGATVTGLTTTGSLTVTGASTLQGGATVTGTTTTGALTVTGAASVGTTLTVTGATTLTGGIAGNVTVSGTLTANSLTANAGASISGTLTVNTVNVNTGTLTVAGATTLNSSLTVAGTASLNGTANVAGVFSCAQHSGMSWQARTTDVVYQAGTDGFVVSHAAVNASAISSTLIGRTGSSNPPTVDVSAQTGNLAFEWVNVFFPVRKGDFYRVTATGGGFISPVMWFIPLGTVTS